MGVKYTKYQNKLYCVYLTALGRDGKINGRYVGSKLHTLIHIQNSHFNFNPFVAVFFLILTHTVVLAISFIP